MDPSELQVVERRPLEQRLKDIRTPDSEIKTPTTNQPRYPTDLKNFFEAAIGSPEEVQDFISQIESGLRHLWSLGWAHNDVSPYGVAVAWHERKPVIINLRNSGRFRGWIFEPGQQELRGRLLGEEPSVAVFERQVAVREN